MHMCPVSETLMPLPSVARTLGGTDTPMTSPHLRRYEFSELNAARVFEELVDGRSNAAALARSRAADDADLAAVPTVYRATNLMFVGGKYRIVVVDHP